MNVYLHENYLVQQRRRARRLQTIGFVCILVSFAMSLGAFLPETYWLIFLAYPFLIVGFPVWSIGRAAVRRIANSPRPDVLLNAEFKGLNNKYSLHHYPMVGTSIIPHMLVTPSGVVVMVSSDAAGPVSCKGGEQGDRWKSPSNFLDRMTGLKPQIGNPSADAEAALAAARKVLAEVGKPEVAMRGLVVFTRNPDVSIADCSFQGVPMNEVRQASRELEADMAAEFEESRNVRHALAAEDRRRLDRYLAPETITLTEKAATARK